MSVVHTAFVLGLLAASRLAAQAPYHVEQLADGIFAIVRHDPIAFANNANSVVIIGNDDVVVVDAQYTRAATLQTLAAIRRLTPKPVRFVINTHWHDDHVAGNQVYRDSFPAVEFIAHEATREDLVTLGRPNRAATLAVTDSYTKRLERLMASGLGIDSTPLVGSERTALLSTISIAREYQRDAATFRETLPTLTLSRWLTLTRGTRRIEVRHFGRGNTRGDVIVFVPDAGVVATGDLLVAPVPFAFNSFPSDWIASLDSIRALAPTVIVPGHGPVMHDDSYLRQVTAMLTAVRDQVASAIAHDVPLDEVRRTVTLDDLRRTAAGGDEWVAKLFGRFFLRPAIDAAYGEQRAAAGSGSGTRSPSRVRGR
jgi:glyoxylase-like metal-dependent hydrolase (beta-lactamase superfamily II)